MITNAATIIVLEKRFEVDGGGGGGGGGGISLALMIFLFILSHSIVERS